MNISPTGSFAKVIRNHRKLNLSKTFGLLTIGIAQKIGEAFRTTCVLHQSERKLK